LKRLFALESLKENLLFKGGTSLSKVYRVIRRFSEDIDASIHRGSLGFSGKDDPANPDLSGKARKRQEEALAEAARAKIASEIRPELEKMIADQGLKEEWSLTDDKSDPDGQSLAFTYPRSSFTQTATDYLRPSVKIEFGARSDHWPAEIKEVQPYLAETIPDSLKDAKVSVKVMGVHRTFWEKATILHQMSHLPADKPFPARYSRHYSDTAEMIGQGVADAAAHDEDLLKAVVEHKQTFFRSSWANYGTAKRGTLHLLPSDKRIDDLRKDLQSMREMFFDAPPELDRIVEVLGEWQDGFNSTGKK
jgi:hypothetical protein